MCFSSLLLTISSQLVASFSQYTACTFHLCLSSLLLFYCCNVIEIMPSKFQGFGECRFGGSEKDRYYLKIPKWQHKFIQDYKGGKLASYFPDKATKTC